MNERIKELKIMKNIIAKYTNMKNVVNRTFMVKKTYFKCLCAVLLMIGTCAPANAGVKILEATGFQAVKAPNNATNTNNTWNPGYASGGTFGACSTTANGVTISSSQMTINTTNFAIKKGKTFTISVSSGAIYRIVFKPKDSGNISANFSNSNGVWGGNNTWQCADNYWGFTEGKSSVTFTNNFGTNFALESINVYTYRDASAAEASFSPTSFNVTAGNVEAKYTTFTTNLGTFDGANSPYNNGISAAVGTSNSDIEFYGASASSYSNGSSIDINIYPYNAGNYTGVITLGRQTSADQANNYHMVSIWADFTVHVNDACTETPTLAFATTGTINKKLGDATFTNAATSTPGIETTGQTISYSSSDSEVATVNSSGQVTLGSKCGTTTITASVESNGTYCSASTTYTINLSGYNVTFHYPACAESSPANLTNQHGSIDLETAMAVDGYRFAGWTDHEVADAASVTPLYTSTVSVSADIDLYAVYTKTSSTFTLVDKGITSPTDGEYVIVSSYSAGLTKVLTADIDAKYKISANTGDYTITAVKTLSCQEEACIWTITAVSGGFTIRNNSTGKYLAAASGVAGSSDQKLRLESSTGDYTTWSISRESDKVVPFTTTNNKRNTDGETRKNLMCNGDYYAFYGSGTNPYLFKRASASGTYTSNPDCNAKEYKVTIQQQSEGTVTASASANGTWADPVLSGLHGSETITITATPDSYHDFSSWTVVSGGVTLSPNTTTATATFTMPTSDVVIRPNFTAKTYTITYKDKGDNPYSGSAIDASYNTYTYGVGLTLPEVTKDDWVFMGWFAETDCSGSRVNSLSTTDNGDKTFYALWMKYSDPLAWCPEPAVHLTGDNVYITSTNGKSIKAVNTLTLNAINLVPGSTVRLSTPANSGIMFSSTGVKYNVTTATIDFTADAGGDITDVPVYVHYYPTTAGTGTPANITVKAEYQTNTAYYSTQDVHVRNMPSSFVIAAKAGGSWYALPANIASATNPASVMIDVDESSWTAKGPSTLAYELWPVKSTTGTADLYATKGEKVRFSGNSNKGLWASTSTNTLNNTADISAITSDPATNYEWNVTTETDGSTWKYKLKMEGQSNFLNLHSDASGLIWGSYSANVASDELYLIPLTPIEPITLKVVEWYPTKVLVKTANDISTATVSINGTPVEKTITKKSGASCELYEISGLSTLTSNPTKTLTVSYTSGSTYAASVKIPVIIWESQNLVNPSGDPVGGYKPLNEPFASLTKEVYSYADLVVRDGATLTINGTSPQNTFYDVTIYPTSKISVPATNANGASNVFNVHSLTFFGGIDDIYDGSTYTVNKYGVPELSLKGRFGTKTVSTINYDMRVDDSQMYSLTVPYDVDLADITWWDGTSMGTLGDKLWVSAYDGQARANKDMAHTWVYEVNFKSKFGEAKLKQGTGYTISADYQASMGNQTTIIRLPMKSNVAADATEVAKTVPVKAYVNTQGVTVGDNNKGWNLVGNPYMTSIGGGGADDASRLVVGYLRETGTGPWEWVNDTYRYVTIPNDNGTDYDQAKFSQVTLPPFKNFFVQVGNTGEMSFELASRHDAPNRYLQVQDREVEVDIILSNDSRQDNMGLLIAEQYSPAYEINADLEKMIGSMSVYTIYGGYNLAYNALSPDDAKQFIPIGYVAPSAGEYTFSLDDNSDVNEIDHIYLTDYQESVTVDLMEQDYIFMTTSGKNESRFAINATLKEETDTPTDIDIINGGGDLDGEKPIKFIYHDKMYIYHRGVIYDATGKKVREIK